MIRRASFESQYNRSMEVATLPYFYVVQPVPEQLPWQVKLGYTTDVQKRLKSYQGFCPQAHLVKYWYCVDFAMEVQALKAVEGLGLEKLAKEVFVCRDLEHLLTFLDSFFLPEPRAKKRPLPPYMGDGFSTTIRDIAFTPEESAQQLGITVEQLLEWVDDGKIEYYEVPKIYIPFGEIPRLQRLHRVKRVVTAVSRTEEEMLEWRTANLKSFYKLSLTSEQDNQP